MMPPPEVHVFTARQITLGPDEIRGQVGSHAFIYTRYPDPEGNRWFVKPGVRWARADDQQPKHALGIFRPESR
jgi:hypothetical protein